MAARSLLSISDLSVSYATSEGYLTAVDDVTLEFETGKTYALVGESGSGKSTVGLALSRLLPEDSVKYKGRIIYRGVDLLSLREDHVERYRGTEIATVFQEPATSLNPVSKIGEQIAEALWVKERRQRTTYNSQLNRSRNELKTTLANEYIPFSNRTSALYEKFSNTVHELLTKVRIANPERIAKMFPHELSGGMRQRVMIAMALAEEPSLLVADEPTTALDVTTQVRILKLIKSLTREYGMTVLYITHDLGVAATVADYVIVMYAGKIAEEAPTSELFERPRHPYTLGLLASFPKGYKKTHELVTIPGTVPTLGRYAQACRFHPRCRFATKVCEEKDPLLEKVDAQHYSACHHCKEL